MATPVAVLVAALLLLAPLPADPVADSDTARDLLQARACLDEGLCFTAGPAARLPGVRHGALWIHFLVAGLAAGMTLAGLVRIAFLLLAIGVALWYRTARRRWGAGLAWAGALALVPALGWLQGYPLFINPALSALPLLVLWAALVEAASGERPGWLVMGALAAGWLADTYLPFGVMILPVMSLALLNCRRPLRMGALVFAAFVGAFALTSARALGLGLAALGQRPLPVAAAGIGLVLAAGLLLRLRGRWARRSDDGRILGALGIACVVWLVGGALPLAGLQSDFNRLNLLPVVPGAVLLGIGLFHRAGRLPRLVSLRRGWGRWVVSGVPMALLAVCLVAALGFLQTKGHSAQLRFGEVEALAAALEQEGLDGPTIHRALRGPLVRESCLREAMAVFVPAGGGRGRASLRIQVLFSTADPVVVDLPEGWRHLSVHRGRQLLWRTGSPRILSTGVLFCIGSPESGRCRHVREGVGGLRSSAADPLMSPGFLRPAWLEQAGPDGEPVSYGFPVAPWEGPPLVAVLSPTSRERFLRLEGVDGVIEQGGTVAVIQPLSARGGRVWIESREQDPKLNRHPPLPLELEAAETAQLSRFFPLR